MVTSHDGPLRSKYFNLLQKIIFQPFLPRDWPSGLASVTNRVTNLLQYLTFLLLDNPSRNIPEKSFQEKKKRKPIYQMRLWFLQQHELSYQESRFQALSVPEFKILVWSGHVAVGRFWLETNQVNAPIRFF